MRLRDPNVNRRGAARKRPTLRLESAAVRCGIVLAMHRAPAANHT